MTKRNYDAVLSAKDSTLSPMLASSAAGYLKTKNLLKIGIMTKIFRCFAAMFAAVFMCSAALFGQSSEPLSFTAQEDAGYLGAMFSTLSPMLASLAAGYLKTKNLLKIGIMTKIFRCFAAIFAAVFMCSAALFGQSNQPLSFTAQEDGGLSRGDVFDLITNVGFTSGGLFKMFYK